MAELETPRWVWQGEDCLSLRWPPALDLELNTSIHELAHRIAALQLDGLVDIVPSFASLGLQFAPLARPDRSAIEAQVAAALASDAQACQKRDDDDGMEIPVCYHPDTGPDLHSAAECLGLAPETLAARHAQGTYRVALLGFAPGFPYLLGLDPALALPRHAQPRASVAAGSVGIAGAQTGIYPRTSPGGWQLIGRTPWRLFDAERSPPTRLRPGQRIRFRAIDLPTFLRTSEHPA